MKRVLVLAVALLTMLAFASGVMAQAPATTAKPAAAAPEKAAPAPAPKAPAEKAKPKADKPKTLKGATVAAYQPGQMIAVKTKDKEMKFDIAADAKVKGEVKEGAKVNVTYKKDGDKMVATSISGPKPKKEAPKQQEAPKK
jgi:branched-subunit amino acid aminotransferase/4-amino-4-deoxychorismate lyase